MERKLKIFVRVSKEEVEKIRVEAKKLGLPISTYVRMSALKLVEK